MQGLLTLSRCTSLVCLSVLYPQGIETYLPTFKLTLLSLWCHATLARLVFTSSGLLLLRYSQTLYFCCYGTQSYWLYAFMILIATNLPSVWCQTRTAGVVDVISVNIVTWSVGCERVGELAKGWAVVGRLGTRVDGYSPPLAKKLVL